MRRKTLTVLAAVIALMIGPTWTAAEEITIPAEQSEVVTDEPTSPETQEPASEPTNSETQEPASEPTNSETQEPTSEPTNSETQEPTSEPSTPVTPTEDNTGGQTVDPGTNQDNTDNQDTGNTTHDTTGTTGTGTGTTGTGTGTTGTGTGTTGTGTGTTGTGTGTTGTGTGNTGTRGTTGTGTGGTGTRGTTGTGTGTTGTGTAGTTGTGTGTGTTGNDTTGTAEQLPEETVEEIVQEEVQKNTGEENNAYFASLLSGTIVASGTENSLRWALYSSGLLAVTGSGDYTNYRYEEDGEVNYYPAWYQYRTDIKAAWVTASDLTKTTYMFYGCSNMEAVKFTGLKTDTLTRTDKMFYGCSKLEDIYFTAFNTSNVVDMSYMFYGCRKLENVDFDSLDTGNTIWMLSMFEGCRSLTEMSISSWNTQNLRDANSMFKDCTSFTELDISAMDLSSIYNSDYMFSGCENLLSINLSEDAFKSVSSIKYMFESCTNVSADIKFQTPVTDCTKAFRSAATASDAKIIIYFSGDCTEENALAIYKTGTSGSHVYIYPQTPILTAATMTEEGVQINWTGYRPDGYFFRVFRKTDDGKWKKIANTKSNYYVDTKAKTGKNYTYTVRLYNSSKKAVSSYDEDGISVDYVITPYNLKAVCSAKGVKFSWKKVKGVELYRVYRKTTGGSWNNLTDTQDNSFIDTTAESGQTYIYTVRCLSSDGKKYISSYDKEGVSVSYLAQPSLSVSNDKTGTLIEWKAVTAAEEYRVYRKDEKDGSWTRLATISPSEALTYTDTDVEGGQIYWYTVKALAGSAQSSFDTDTQIVVLSMPKVTAEKVSGGIKVTWTASEGAGGYYIYRRTSGSNTRTRIGEVSGVNTLTYTDKTAEEGVTYYYTVRAYNGDDLSPYKYSNKIKR